MFDVDGTLVDSTGFDGRLYARAVREELGVRVDETGPFFWEGADRRDMKLTPGAANTAISVARDAIGGYIIGGTEGMRRNVRWGVASNVFGHAVGLGVSRFSRPTLTEGAWRYNVRKIPLSRGAPAITIGNAVLYSAEQGSTMLFPARYRDHELQHVHTQNTLVGSYIPIHLLSQAMGQIRPIKSRGGNAFMENAPFFPDDYAYRPTGVR